MLKLNGRKAKVAGFIGTVALTGGLLASAVVGTGAYFSDTKANNHITGTMGSIKVEGHDGTGTNNLDAVFTDMLPGETKTAKWRYSNTGKNAQDVWVVFEDEGLVGTSATGKHGINDLGTYAEVHVASNGTEQFASQNLTDKYPSGTPGSNGAPTLYPLPKMIKVADALAPGHTGDWSFSFKPASKILNDAQLDQWLGLDYDLVATQVGVTPAA